MNFTLYIIPKGQQRPRFGYLHGKAVCFKSKSQREYEKQMLAQLKPFIPPKPLECPLTIDITAYMPIPKAWNKAKHKQALDGAILPVAKTADASNVLKNIEDIMNGRFYVDDCQITSANIEKFYGEPPRLVIRLYETQTPF